MKRKRMMNPLFFMWQSGFLFLTAIFPEKIPEGFPDPIQHFFHSIIFKTSCH
jgi:hypothetical protein